MSKDSPKVSIITACLNSRSHLQDAIKSVCEQTYPNIEYLVVDGDSSDGSIEIFERYRNRIDKLLIEKDNGTFDAMNKGIGMVTGEVVYFLNADDRFYDSRVVEKAVESLTKNRTSDFIYGNLVVFNPLSRISYIERYPDRISKWLFVKKTIGHPATFFRSRCFEKAGYFDAKFRLAADYDWFLRAIFNKGLKGTHIDQTISIFRLGGLSTDERFLDQYLSEREAIQKKYFNHFEISCSRLLMRSRKMMGKRLRRFLRNLRIRVSLTLGTERPVRHNE